MNNAPDLGLRLQPDKDGKMRLQRYRDASFNAHEGARSHAGVYVTLGGGGAALKSYKIKIASKSTAEAELNVLSDATSLLAHDRELAIESLRFKETSEDLAMPITVMIVHIALEYSKVKYTCNTSRQYFTESE